MNAVPTPIRFAVFRRSSVAAQQSLHFVHEQRNRAFILTAARCEPLFHFTRENPILPGKPRQSTISARSHVARALRCPQFLWMIVCISCKFTR